MNLLNPATSEKSWAWRMTAIGRFRCPLIHQSSPAGQSQAPTAVIKTLNCWWIGCQRQTCRWMSHGWILWAATMNLAMSRGCCHGMEQRTGCWTTKTLACAARTQSTIQCSTPQMDQTSKDRRKTANQNKEEDRLQVWAHCTAPSIENRYSTYTNKIVREEIGMGHI